MVTLEPFHLGAGPEDFARWAEAGRELFARIAADANEPLQQRTLRDFRKNEAMEIGGFREQQWKRLHPPRAGTSEARATLAEIHSMQQTLGLRPRRPDGTRPIRLTTTGFKGGTTKTMTALTLGHYLAFRGWRVLMVDCDPQGTLSRMYDILPELVDPDATLSCVFSPGKDALLHPMPTHIDGLDLIPASLDMIGADLQVASAFQQGRSDAGQFYRMVDDALTRIEEPYDVVILDTPPAFSFMALTLLWAATALLVPLSPTMADFSATVDYCSMASEITTSLVARSGQDKRWSPVVFVHTRVDAANPVADGVRRMSASVWGDHRIEEYLPVSSAFTNAQARFRGIYETTSSEIDARSLRRARLAADQFGARMVQLFRETWADELGAAQLPTTQELDHG